MQNDLKYTVRSREIVDLVNAMRTSRLSLSPYFQRNMVWRDAHRRDFIDTILKGYPFPQIFLARGPLNVDTMEASQAVVDGQQRLSAIRDFVDGKLDYSGKFFKELSTKQREEFLKYEVAVIDFDLTAGDPRLKDVFHRLNRTYYSLSAIEKLASEYSASEFMLVARVLCGEITNEMQDEEDFGLVNEDDVQQEGLANIFSRDPGVDQKTWDWLMTKADGAYPLLLKSKPIFTPFEFDRKVPLMFTLNAMCTFLAGYYERNNLVRKFLDERADEFPEQDQVIDVFNETATYIDDLNLPAASMWWSKANFFTLFVELSRDKKLRLQKPKSASLKLEKFSQSVPANYGLAAREAVGRRAQRDLRGEILRKVLGDNQVEKAVGRASLKKPAPGSAARRKRS